MKAREGPSAQDGAERIITPTGQFFEEVSLERFWPIIQQWAFRRLWMRYEAGRPQQCVHHGRRFLRTLVSSVLPCRLSFESERLTEDGGDVPSGEPREPVLRFSSRLLFVHHAVYHGISSLGSGAGFRHGRRGLPYVL